MLLVLPWLALGLCVAIPIKRIETLVLNFNLGMAFLSLCLALGYILYATSQGGWRKIIQEADMLLLLSPFYYAGVSLWIARQRVSLKLPKRCNPNQSDRLPRPSRPSLV